MAGVVFELLFVFATVETGVVVGGVVGFLVGEVGKGGTVKGGLVPVPEITKWILNLSKAEK